MLIANAPDNSGVARGMMPSHHRWRLPSAHTVGAVRVWFMAASGRHAPTEGHTSGAGSAKGCGNINGRQKAFFSLLFALRHFKKFISK